jgi:hypothetical protein
LSLSELGSQIRFGNYRITTGNQSSGSKISIYIIDMTLIKWRPNGYVYIDSGMFELLTNGGYLYTEELGHPADATTGLSQQRSRGIDRDYTDTQAR